MRSAKAQYDTTRKHTHTYRLEVTRVTKECESAWLENSMQKTSCVKKVGAVSTHFLQHLLN